MVTSKRVNEVEERGVAGKNKDTLNRDYVDVSSRGVIFSMCQKIGR